MYGDMHRMVPSLASFKGFSTAEIEVEHHARVHGVSKYGWERLTIGAFDTMTVGFLQRFRNSPMHFAGKVSGVLVLIAMGLFLSAVIVAIAGGTVGVLVILGAISALTALLVCMQGLMSEQRVYRSMEQGRNLMVSETSNSDEAQAPLHFAQYEQPSRDVLAAS